METIPPFIQTSPTKIPPMNPNIPTHLTHKSTIAILDSVEDQSQPIPAEMIIDNSIILSESVVTDPDECMIGENFHLLQTEQSEAPLSSSISIVNPIIFSVDVLPINSTHQFSRTMDEEDQKEGVKESTGQVRIIICVVQSVVITTSGLHASHSENLNYHNDR